MVCGDSGRAGEFKSGLDARDPSVPRVRFYPRARVGSSSETGRGRRNADSLGSSSSLLIQRYTAGPIPSGHRPREATGANEGGTRPGMGESVRGDQEGVTTVVSWSLV